MTNRAKDTSILAAMELHFARNGLMWIFSRLGASTMDTARKQNYLGMTKMRDTRRKTASGGCQIMKKNKSKKIVLWILAIILVVVLGAVGGAFIYANSLFNKVSKTCFRFEFFR